MPAPFWKTKTLAEMNGEEWESLCDGCGKCCLHKIEDEDTGEIFFTRVACRMLDIASCRCTDYPHRTTQVPECLNVREQLDKLHWLPSTCAYRLLAEGRDLAPWHPLVSGRRESVHRTRVSVRDYAIPEPQAGPIEEHVIEWLT